MSTRHDISKRPEGIFGLMLHEAEAGDEVIYPVGQYAIGPHKKAHQPFKKRGTR